jgi:F-type H+-transporting ATPase subunit epsilon
MRVVLRQPSRVLLETDARKVTAEGLHGHFALLPHHVDFVVALVPSVLGIVDADGRERLFGTDEGTLVKCGGDVLVAVRDAVEGEDLARLRGEVAAHYRDVDEAHRSSRSALARLESAVVRRFLELDRGLS